VCAFGARGLNWALKVSGPGPMDLVVSTKPAPAPDTEALTNAVIRALWVEALLLGETPMADLCERVLNEAPEAFSKKSTDDTGTL